MARDEHGAAEPPSTEGKRLWPMGAVTRRTGISEHTLRAWERRFGVPRPRRLPSGHRRYTSEQVRHLRLVALALERGHRAGDVVPLERGELERLLQESGALASASHPQDLKSWIDELLSAARDLDRERLDALLQQEAASLGVPRFLRERVEPSLLEIGEAWARGALDVRHEHFATEVLEDRLRSLRLAVEGAARGRPVVLACLPEERHALGLQMVALAVAAAGRTVRVLGPHTPVDEIATAANDLRAVVVGVSISEFAEPEAVAEGVAALRAELPASVALWVGGRGAEDLHPLPAQADRLITLEDLGRALGALQASSP